MATKMVEKMTASPRQREVCSEGGVMIVIDQQFLDEITEEAKGSPRLRKNRNLHHGDEAPCHRLLNAMEPGSYIMPHRHLSEFKDESLVIVRGALGVISFDEAGNVVDAVRLEAGGNGVAVNIPHGSFHTVVSFASGSVFFESKGGPYTPIAAAEKAPWAPEEGSPDAPLFHQRLLECF
ncbi:WbuC family cupin fold metalloprotein [Geomonas sp. RF6]|uniref:WbuC family cupin fold metalloprotein n=1 Tax=Geomonas sp. RF6 TaxID=2897342 RepID=UPI001E3395C8|nr:WbuC family cupin fold metalloprotein [Geomonas sp. RF6]UFS71560.1 WbuC family cupin fold metalloprotein [Geomonas sp. RF6]